MSAMTSAKAGIPKSAKCFAFAPPKKSIISVTSPTHTVTDMFGSAIISAQVAPQATSTNAMDAKVTLLLFARQPDTKTTKVNLAMSEG